MSIQGKEPLWIIAYKYPGEASATEGIRGLQIYLAAHNLIEQNPALHVNATLHRVQVRDTGDNLVVIVGRGSLSNEMRERLNNKASPATQYEGQFSPDVVAYLANLGDANTRKDPGFLAK